MEEAREKRADIKEQLDKYEEDIQKVKEDLNKLYTKKNEIREQYYQTKLEYEIERDEIHQAEYIAKEKQRLIDREAQKKERIEARKQELLDRPNPYAREIETCEHLIGYCNRLKVISGLGVPAPDEAAKQEQQKIITQINKEEVKKKLDDGKLQRVKTKEEREAEGMVVVGGGKKGAKKQKKKEKQFEIEVPFNIDITMINKFGFLKISPPLNKESLDTKIKELEEKRVKYNEEGEARLKEDEEKLAEGLYDFKEEEEQYNEDEPRYQENSRGGRGGRGGGDIPYTEGGNRRVGYRKDEDREEREVYVDEDEGMGYSEPIAKQEPRRNKKENLQFTEENYPEL